jgi:hypothetical protein
MAVPITSEAMAAEVLSSVIKGCTDYLACREYEKTERERIGALLEVALAQINANVEIYQANLALLHSQVMSVCDALNEIIKRPDVNPEIVRLSFQFLSSTQTRQTEMLNSALSAGQSMDIRRLR